MDMETSLYLLGSGGGGRYYDPATGRFISPDRAGFSGGDVNLYVYVGNNPINRIDPSGRSWWSDFKEGLSNAASAGIDALANTGRAIVNTVQAVGGVVLEGIEDAAMATFNAGLRTLGISPDTFVQNIKELGGNVTSTLKELVLRGNEIFSNLVSGVFRGVEVFCGSSASASGTFSCPKFFDRMLTALADWLGIPALADIVREWIHLGGYSRHRGGRPW
jgi:RHS repeat-associated protein